MLRDYFKIAYRNIKRQKLYTTINILGLSLGLCACIVIYLINSYEFSFDDFHPDRERIYRVMGDVTENTGARLHFAKLPQDVSQNGRAELQGIDEIAGLIPFNAGIDVPGNNNPPKRFESRTTTNYITTAITQPQYFAIFQYKWIAGDPVTALNAPLKVVLTETSAKKYFNDEPLNEIIGKQIIYADSLTVTVSGIIKDWDGNTDLAFTDFISSSTLQHSFLKSRIKTGSWKTPSMNTWTFVKLGKGINPIAVDDQLNALVKKYAGPEIKLKLWLEPLAHVHFNADVIENPIRTADKATLYSLVAIALFILILAIINFINLATAQSIQREKEIGIRKVLGSPRSSLIFRFLVETLLLTLAAVSIAVLLVNPVLAAFHSFIPDGVTFHFFNPSVILFLVMVTLATSVLAGLYPAKVLSSYLPVSNLKGPGTQKGGDKWILRKGLIVFQFSVSIVFIIGSIVVANQLKYTREKDPGFRSDAIVIVSTPGGDSLSKISVLAAKLKTIAGIENVALQWLPPMSDNGRAMQLKFKSTDTNEIEVGQVAGNEDFIPVYNIKLLAGRNLVHADSVKEYIINETFLKSMGYKEPGEAIGKILYWNDRPYPIVGVVADFHTASFHDPIAPLCIINRPDRQRSLAIKFATDGNNGQSIKNSISKIETAWKQIYPDRIFNYQFYDESLSLLYKRDQQTAKLITTAMAITILISCIGLFGLALFAAEKRAKEISIRKVLGATAMNIAAMLSKDFALLVLFALCIAAPVAWYFMDQWLQNFAYRVNIGWWMFGLAGLVVIIIALVTVGFQAIRSATANPINNLRRE